MISMPRVAGRAGLKSAQSGPLPGPIWAVTSVRLHAGHPEKLTRLFRHRAAADRYARRQQAVGHVPVALWSTGTQWVRP